ncbi:hypothetical protein [Laceyella putida]|uniref:Uncharacterized protein n=1 Tax=Laceyella putida TaxID=110101 RepID=A0ABW2RL55_9BACL
MIDSKFGEQLELFPEILEKVAREKQQEADQRKQEARKRARLRARERRQMMKERTKWVEPPKLAEVIPFKRKDKQHLSRGGDVW